MSRNQVDGRETESLGWRIVRNMLAARGTDADRLALDSILRSVDAGERDSRAVVRELKKRRRPRAGEFGLEVASGMLLGLVVPAVFEFLKLFAKKFVEKSGEIAAEKSIEALLAKKLTTKADADGTWADLERCFAAKAKELGLPAGSYRELLEQFRDHPALLVRSPKRSE